MAKKMFNFKQLNENESIKTISVKQVIKEENSMTTLKDVDIIDGHFQIIANALNLEGCNINSSQGSIMGGAL